MLSKKSCAGMNIVNIDGLLSLRLVGAQGNADTQSYLAATLGMIHEELGGPYGPKDKVDARRLCGLAAAQGHADAQL